MFCSKVLQLVQVLVISIVSYTSIDVQNVISYEPDQIAEIGYSCFIDDKLMHGIFVYSKYIQSDCSNGNPNHTFAVVEKLDCFSIKWEIICMIIVEEMNCMFV